MPRNTKRRVPKGRKGGRKKNVKKSGGKTKFDRPSKTIIRQPSGISDRLFVKLKYNDNLTFTSTSGGLSLQKYRGNSLFDPDQTGTGHQPYLFDQWATMYTNYLVHGAKIVIRSVPIEAASVSQYSGTLVVVPTFDSTSYTSVNQMIEQPYSRYTMAGANTKNSNSKIIRYISTRKLLGAPKHHTEGSQLFRAGIGSNPTSPWFYQLAYQSTDLSTTTSIDVSIDIFYYVEFYARARPAQS